MKFATYLLVALALALPSTSFAKSKKHHSKTHASKSHKKGHKPASVGKKKKKKKKKKH